MTSDEMESADARHFTLPVGVGSTDLTAAVPPSARSTPLGPRPATCAAYYLIQVVSQHLSRPTRLRTRVFRLWNRSFAIRPQALRFETPHQTHLHARPARPARDPQRIETVPRACSRLARQTESIFRVSGVRIIRPPGARRRGTPFLHAASRNALPGHSAVDRCTSVEHHPSTNVAHMSGKVRADCVRNSCHISDSSIPTGLTPETRMRSRTPSALKSLRGDWQFARACCSVLFLLNLRTLLSADGVCVCSAGDDSKLDHQWRGITACHMGPGI